MAMDQLINSLPALLRAAGNAEEISEAAALAVWNHLAGEGLRPQTAATRLHNQKLTVAVPDAVWQQQLQSLSGQFLFRLNALLGQGTVRIIEFCIDPSVLRTIRRPERQTNGSPTDGPRNTQPIPFELISAAAAINDPGLRRAFLGAASSCVRRQETRQPS